MKGISKKDFIANYTDIFLGLNTELCNSDWIYLCLVGMEVNLFVFHSQIFSVLFYLAFQFILSLSFDSPMDWGCTLLNII